jgi:membrane associated rhomboid family serine protease
MQNPGQHIFFAHVRAANFIWIIWVCFFLQICLALLGVDIAQFGVVPHTLRGTIGIFTMPFLHGNFGHIIMNSIGLLMVLLPLYVAFKDQAHVPEVILKIILISGVLVWIFGRQNSSHIGASALVYGLTTYILAAGIVYRHPLLIMFSILNLCWMGGSFFSGMMPGVGPQVSWEGHICGAVAGLFVGSRKWESQKDFPPPNSNEGGG